MLGTKCSGGKGPWQPPATSAIVGVLTSERQFQPVIPGGLSLKHSADFIWDKITGKQPKVTQVEAVKPPRESRKERKARKARVRFVSPAKIPRGKMREWYREDYLNSDHWKELRARRLSNHKCCERCGAKGRLDVHHLRYRRIFNVKVKDLRVLCRSCHDLYHRLVGTVKKRELNRDFTRALTQFSP